MGPWRCVHTTQINAATARGARPHRQSADEHAPNAAHAHRARRRPAALACAGSMHAAARGPADRPDSLPCQQGSAEHLPAGLVRVTLLHSGATRTACMRTLVSASPSLDTHPHCYHSCIIPTHHSCARPAASALTHKNVPHLSKGSLQLAPALRAPPPRVSYSNLRPRRQHVLQVRRPPAPLKPCQQARTHADRPLCSCQQLQLQPPIPRDINLTHDSYSESHHPGRLESCSPPAVSHPLGRRPLTMTCS